MRLRSSYSGREWDVAKLDRALWQARRSLPVQDFALFSTAVVVGGEIPKQRCDAIARNLLVIDCKSSNCYELQELADDMRSYLSSDDRRAYKLEFICA